MYHPALADLSETAELALYKQCSGDIVYRLRYDTMQYDYISPAVESLLGFSVDELMQINMRSLILETRIIEGSMLPVDSYIPLEEKRRQGNVRKWQADYLMQTKDGRTIRVSDISYPWFDADGAIIGSSGSLRDISDRIAAEQKMREQTHVKQDFPDILSRLDNAGSCRTRLEEEIKRVHRTRLPVSLMLVSIRNVPEIREGDAARILQDTMIHVAGLLKAGLRDIDSVAYMQETVFAVILPATSVKGAGIAAGRIVELAKFNVSCQLSTGIAGIEEGTAPMDAQSLYKAADAMLHAAVKAA